jgi:TetR/AcrR family transcriptional repressor of nem operon
MVTNSYCFIHSINASPSWKNRGDIARMPLVARKCFEVGIQRLTDAFADILKTLQKPQPEMLAASIVAKMVGAMTISRSIPNAELSERILNAARASIKGRISLTAD